MLFAERVIIEEGTHKYSILGVFDRFLTGGFPAVFLPWSIYAVVTNLEGEHKFTMTLVRDATQETLVTVNGGFNVADKYDVVQLQVPVAGVVFPAEGDYALRFQVDGESVGSRMLRVTKGAAT